MKSFAFVALTALASASALAQTTFTLDFDGAEGYVNPILEFYNGGTDSLGQSGTNFGVSFTSDAVGLSNDALGPYYSNAPSPVTVLYAASNAAFMNVAAGIVGLLSFEYSSTVAVANAVKIYAGLNGTGAVLGSVFLLGNANSGCNATAFCNFDMINVPFIGTARSVGFGGGSPKVLFDNVTITAVPEPGTYAMLLAGLGVVGLLARRRRF